MKGALEVMNEHLKQHYEPIIPSTTISSLQQEEVLTIEHLHEQPESTNDAISLKKIEKSCLKY